jgi:hypothetical protein
VSGLLAAPENARVAADHLLAQAEELRWTAVDHPPSAGGPPPVVADGTARTAVPLGSCLTLPGAGDASPPVELPCPGVTVSGPVGSVEIVELRRFATSFPVRYELRGAGVLLIRTDRSPRHWQLRVSGPGPTRICGIGAGQP